MKKTLLLAALMFMSPLAKTSLMAANDTRSTTESQQQYSSISGRVIDANTKAAIPYAAITVKGTTRGVTTDENGRFILSDLNKTRGLLRINILGYTTREVRFSAGEQNIVIEMQPSSFNVDEVVVSANRSETRRRMAPVLVNVTDEKLFQATASVDLDQALKFNPGVRVEDNCQNCGFNQVRINGLDGPYSQIIINSRNVFSALAGVYALEMLPTEMIDRVEVVRGGGSALFGSSAIGGTINIITKAPTRNMSSFSYLTEFTQDNFKTPSHNANFFSSTVSKDYKAGISVFGRMKSRRGIDLVRSGSKLKGGKDGFTDIPRLHSATVGTSLFLTPMPESKVSLDYFYTQEDRRGGDVLDLPEHEANIAESLRHKIHTAILKYDQFVADGNGLFTAFTSGSYTKRNSFYGGGPISVDDFKDIETKEGNTPIPVVNIAGDVVDRATAGLGAYGLTRDVTIQSGLQYVHNFDRFAFMPAELTLGLEHTYNKMNDNSGYRPEKINQLINTTSAILQNEWKSDLFGFLLGMRYDHVNMNPGKDHAGVPALKNLNIITPRVTLRYNPTEQINIRLAYAEGFRAPAYFDEELHVAFAGGEGKPRVLAKDLKEERSRSITGSLDWYTNLSDNVSFNFMTEGFFTRLFNRFTAVEDATNKITVIRNKDEEGNAVNASVYGVNLEGRFGFGHTSSLQLGMTFQKSLYDKAQAELDNIEARKEFMRTPDLYGYFVWSYKPAHGLSFDLSGDFTGPMWIAHEKGDKDGDYIVVDKNQLVKTKSFMTLNAKLAYEFHIHKSEMELNLGVNNILNSYQKDFDEGPNRASAYIYGPKMPRTIFAGIKFNL